MREYINEYLTEMSTIIRNRYRGTLDKYIGDAIMAFWGAPVEDPDHARNAVLAALEMQRECATLNAKLPRGWPRLSIGVGVNTGNVRVGDMGSRVRRAYTAMGDAVNVASRLEGRTKLRSRRPGRRGDAQPGQRCGIQGNRPHPGQGEGGGGHHL